MEEKIMIIKKIYLLMPVLILANGITILECGSIDDYENDIENELVCNTGKTIIITGIPELTWPCEIFAGRTPEGELMVIGNDFLELAYGEGTVSKNGTISFYLLDYENDNTWTRSGNYYLELRFDNASIYTYTDGKTFEQLGLRYNMNVEEIGKRLPKYHISQSSLQTISFSKFIEDLD
jgi:hypothetical protein